MRKKTYSSVFKLLKLKTDSQISGASEHNLRTKQPSNADPNRKVKNKVIVGAGHTILSLVNQRTKECAISPRKNAVRAWEILLTAGPQFFKNIKANGKSQDEWTTAALDYLREKFGEKNLVHATLHDDESTLHLHAIVLPIVAANDTGGPVNKKVHRDREWKLDSKGILERYADRRRPGPNDRAAAEFRISDVKNAAGFVSNLNGKTEPVAAFLAGKMDAKALKKLKKPKVLLVEKRKILVAELNKILTEPAIFDEKTFAEVQLSPATKQLKDSNPTGDDCYRLNRKLLDDALPKFITPTVRRPVGSPTAPFMHELQVEYFNLCKTFDAQISEPLYRSKIEHTVLQEFYAALEKDVGASLQIIKNLEIAPPDPLKLITPREHIKSENERIRVVIQPLIAAAQEAGLLRTEVEKLKAAIRLVNQSHAPEDNLLLKDNDQLRNQNQSLKTENEKLTSQLRGISLVEVMQKMGFPQPVPDKENHFRLPDERIIKISGQNFSEITGGYGLGKMNKRQSAKGAIDLVMFITGWELSATRHWLKKSFDLAATLVAAADNARVEAEVELKQAIPPEVAAAINFPVAIYYKPDETEWLKLRKRLVEEYKLSGVLIDDLRHHKKIHANQFGALVCCQYTDDWKFAAAVVQSIKSNCIVGEPFEFQVQRDPHPFEIGTVKGAVSAVLATPLEALAYAPILGGENHILVTTKPLPSQMVAGFAERAAKTNAPVILAYDTSPEGEALAAQMKDALDTAHVPSERHAPPQFSDKVTGWPELVRAAKGKVAEFGGVALGSVQTLTIECINFVKDIVKRLRKPQAPGD